MSDNSLSFVLVLNLVVIRKITPSQFGIIFSQDKITCSTLTYNNLLYFHIINIITLLLQNLFLSKRLWPN